MPNALRLINLKRNFEDVQAVKGVSFDVKQGEMFGLVGPDGAGKTTTIRMLCGLLTPDGGTAFIFDKDVTKEKKAVQNQIGYLSQKFSLYGDLSIDENIAFFAEIHNIKEYEERRDELLEFTRLKPFRDRPAEKLSGGMKQKLALACSLIHRPKILFLDEPTTGVDPVSRRDFWKILATLKKQGMAILLTTPYLDEAERCERVALMNQGKIITLDTPENVRNTIGMKVLEMVCEPIREGYRIIRDTLNLNVQLFGDRIHVITANTEEDIKKIEALYNQKQITIKDYRVISPSLENVFIHLVEDTYG